MKQRIFLFAGTSEGRLLGEFLSEAGLCADVFVATEYGRETFPQKPGLTLHEGRLDQRGMEEAVTAGSFVIDATHPYAAEASANLQKACDGKGAEYLRLLRPSKKGDLSGCILAGSAKEAADLLDKREGNILLTTGSKELAAFAGTSGFSERLYVRVLPSPSILEQCRELGIPSGHIIAMQGPFSQSLNAALLKQVNARFLVTKDTGREGGFPEKLAAARQCGVTPLVIARPLERGSSFEAVKGEIVRRFGLSDPPKEGVHFPRFPIFIDLWDRPVLVVGGGEIASRRVEVLCRFGAKVTVISPEITAVLDALWKRGKICWERRTYENDVDSGYALIVAATGSRESNHQVGEAAKSLSIPVSVADSREESSFYFPAIVEESGLLGGFVSKDGKNHRLVREKAEQIRQMLRNSFNES